MTHRVHAVCMIWWCVLTVTDVWLVIIQICPPTAWTPTLRTKNKPLTLLPWNLYLPTCTDKSHYTCTWSIEGNQALAKKKNHIINQFSFRRRNNVDLLELVAVSRSLCNSSPCLFGRLLFLCPDVSSWECPLRSRRRRWRRPLLRRPLAPSERESERASSKTISLLSSD